MDQVQLGAAIIAVTEAIKRVLPDAVTGIVTIAVAAVLGGLWALYQGTDIIIGIVTGLAASGIVKVADAVSSKK